MSRYRYALFGMLSILAITFPTAAVASITMPTATTQPAFNRVTVATAYPSISDEAQATAEDVKEVPGDFPASRWCRP